MPKVNPVYTASANSCYAQGGFVPRPKGARYKHLYDLFPQFANQQGEVHAAWEDRPNPIVNVEFLGTFLGYGVHGNEVTYRGFKVTLNTGLVVAGYSNNADQFVMCLHTGYVHNG